MAFDAYKEETQDIRYELSYDEAVSLTLYAFAFNTDQTTQLNRLKMARRPFEASSKSISLEALGGARRGFAQNAMLTYGGTIIVDQTPGYNTDADIEQDTDPIPLEPITRTKAVRGG